MHRSYYSLSLHDGCSWKEREEWWWKYYIIDLIMFSLSHPVIVGIFVEIINLDKMKTIIKG